MELASHVVKICGSGHSKQPLSVWTDSLSDKPFKVLVLRAWTELKLTRDSQLRSAMHSQCLGGRKRVIMIVGSAMCSALR